MKFTLSWLKEHLRTEASLDEIAARLTMLGLEVEDIVDRGAALAGVVVGEVVRHERHPDADRLSLCTVETGSGSYQVVCGAPNVRAGLKGAFAAGGTVIPAWGEALKKTKIRGVESQGMLCSARELGLGEDHEGIIELPADAPVGAAYGAYAGLDDPLIDIAITPDRADCLGVRGIARDLAAAGMGTLRDDVPWLGGPVAGAFPAPVGIHLDFPSEAADACPLFMGRVIRNVKNGESPPWMRRRLEAVGLRPISALVDITNWLTFDLCRPLHVFDADRLDISRSGALTVRLARPGEKLLALNDREYELDPAVAVIADDKGVQSLGGVIGGAATGCTPETVNVLIEAALFDPLRTAATGRRLNIESDARYRFERGLDPAGVGPGLEAATRLILELCGGEAGEVVAAEGPSGAKTQAIAFRPERVASLVGVDVAADESAGILQRLGFAVEKGKSVWQVTVPSWRADVMGEADLVEEVVRIHGYDAIPETPMPPLAPLPEMVLTAGQRRLETVRRLLASRGMLETVTWSFIGGAEAALFGADEATPRLANPISADLDVMRPSLVAALARAAGRNRDRGQKTIALFEIGPQFRDASQDGQEMIAAGLRAGETGPRHWAASPRPFDVFDVKADVFAVLDAAGLAAESVQVMAGAAAWYHPGRAGTLCLGPKKILGYFGELHPGVLKALGLEGPHMVFEIHMGRLPPAKDKVGRRRALFAPSNLPPVERDFAFVVDEAVPAADLIRALNAAEKTLIADIDVFDQYAGASLGEGRKSLAVRVTLQPQDKTLTDDEINKICDRLVAGVEKATGGHLRS